jgi:pimeloyl-ACP methyl ester carboxylesterase
VEDIMEKRTFLNALAWTMLAAAITPAAFAQDAVKSGYAQVNGLEYYYEITGKGEPLLVLHGGLGSIHVFGLVSPALAEGRQIIAVDLHGHGHTLLGTRDTSLVDQGADMASLIKQLGYT